MLPQHKKNLKLSQNGRLKLLGGNLPFFAGWQRFWAMRLLRIAGQKNTLPKGFKRRVIIGAMKTSTARIIL